MTIKNLPVRYAEIGRLRLGQRNDDGKMEALDTWRMTSKDRFVIEAAAEMFGGVVAPWNADGRDEWEVLTDVSLIPVAMPVMDPLYCAYEKWGSGGKQRTCDGEFCTVPVEDPEGGHLDEADCVCAVEGWTPSNAKDVKAGACVVTTRLKVVMPELPGAGIWLMTTGSIMAAMELPAQVSLLQAMAQNNMIVPAVLAIEAREHKRTDEKFMRKYHVPTIRIRESLSALAAGRGGLLPHSGSPAVGSPATAALPAGTGGRSAPSVSSESSGAVAPDDVVDALGGTVESVADTSDRRAHVKVLISGLAGKHARAWPAARNGMGMGSKIDDWSDEQVEKAIDFLEAGAVPS